MSQRGSAKFAGRFRRSTRAARLRIQRLPTRLAFSISDFAMAGLELSCNSYGVRCEPSLRGILKIEFAYRMPKIDQHPANEGTRICRTWRRRQKRLDLLRHVISMYCFNNLARSLDSENKKKLLHSSHLAPLAARFPEFQRVSVSND